MIVRMSEIYREIAAESIWSKSVIESVGTEVLSYLRDTLNSPSEIAYELPKLGTFTMHLDKYKDYHKFLLESLASGKYKLGQDYSEEMFEKNKILKTKIDAFYAKKELIKQLKHEKKTRESSENVAEEHR